MRIGIFGGAFDPPHRGHETAAMAFLKEAGLDLCYCIPSGIPPHKEIRGAKAGDRLEMARLAFSPLSDRFAVSDMELVRSGTSYSYLTVEEIASRHPESEIFLFVGTDQFLVFETWKRARELLSRVTLCVMSRYGEEEEVLLAKKEALEKEFGAECLLLREKAYIISSTQVREDVAEKGFSHALSPGVNEYITKRRLYASSKPAVREKLLAELERELSPKRFSHTLAVEREMDRLCGLFSIPEQKELSLSALWHDFTKEWSLEKQLRFLTEQNAAPLPADLLSPAVIHGKTAAILAEREGGLSREAADAIRFHTTGRRAMTLPEKLLYLADYIEETRTHSVCREMRERFYRNMPKENEARWSHLDDCLLSVMEQTASHLKTKNLPIHPDTLEGILDLKERKTHDSH